MRRIFTLLFVLFTFFQCLSQTNVLNTDVDLYIPDPDGSDVPSVIASSKFDNNLPTPQGCASSNTLVTGYPAWTNYWGGWMVNINNISTNTITINCFEARFQGTSGYRIYTKTGTFVGFETTSAAWTLIGTAANVASISSTTSSPIPITVNTTINPGTTRAFYLTRTDNLIANRHLYVAGVGTPGTTVYSADANLQITEANYIDTYFINMGGTRRPSFQVYYSPVVPLPVELLSFNCTSNQRGIELNWITATEHDNDYFAIERSADGKNFEEIARISGAGNSTSETEYRYMDKNPLNGINYYRLKQVDFNGNSTNSDLSACAFKRGKTKINVYSYTGVLLASSETEDHSKTLEELGLSPGIYLIELAGDEPVFFKHVEQ